MKAILFVSEECRILTPTKQFSTFKPKTKLVILCFSGISQSQKVEVKSINFMKSDFENS